MGLVTTARATPAGFRMDDGQSTLIAFALDPNIAFWEKSVPASGWDNDSAIPTTTMHNVRFRTFAPRKLITKTEISLTAAYDPAVLDQIQDIMGVPGSITLHFPDGSTDDFFGYLRQFTPSDLQEGVQPEATIVIQPTNYDPDLCVEAGPVVTAVGTCVNQTVLH